MKKTKLWLILTALFLLLFICLIPGPKQPGSNKQNAPITYTENTDSFVVKLKDNEKDSIQSASYTIFEKKDTGIYFPVLSDCSVTANSKGEIHIPKNQSVFMVETDSEPLLWSFRQISSTKKETVWESEEYSLRETASDTLSHGDSTPILTRIIDKTEGMTSSTPDINNWNTFFFLSSYYEPRYDKDNHILAYKDWPLMYTYLDRMQTKKAGEKPQFIKVPLQETDKNFYCQLILTKKDQTISASDLMELQPKDPDKSLSYKTATEKGMLSYSRSDDGIIITGYTGEDEILSLPSVIDNTPVTAIGLGAFDYCKTLKSLTLPEGMKEIGDHAFSNCTALQKLEIPSTVDKIGNGILAFASSVNEIAVSPQNPNYKTRQGLLLTGDSKKILASCMNGSVSCRIPDGIEELCDFVFAGSRELKHVTFPETLKTIGVCAFFDTGLSDIQLPESLTRIGSQAFGGYADYYGRSYTMEDTLHIGKNISRIGRQAFQGAFIKKFLVDPENSAYTSRDGIIYTKDGTVLIECPTGRQGTLSIPDGVLDIDLAAFYNNGKLHPDEIPAESSKGITALILSDSVKNLYGNYFPAGLKKVSIGSGLTHWPHITSCVDGVEVEISKNNPAFTLEDHVIYNKEKTSLIVCLSDKEDTEFIVPNTVTRIEDNAFLYYDNLKSIVIPDSVDVRNPVTGNIYGLNALGRLKSVTVTKNHPSLSSIDGMLFDKNGEILLVYPPGKKDTDLTLPEGVKQIGDRALDGAGTLESLMLPASFSMADNLNHILGKLYSLTELIIEPSNPSLNVTDGIVYATFHGKETAVYLLANAPEIVYLKEGITKIDSSVFKDLSTDTVITEVHIPEGVTSIASGNFNQIAGKDMWDTVHVFLPDSLTAIDTYSFDTSPGVVIHAKENTYGAAFAKEHGLTLETE